jgi:hypothetical protein
LFTYILEGLDTFNGARGLVELVNASSMCSMNADQVLHTCGINPGSNMLQLHLLLCWHWWITARGLFGVVSIHTWRSAYSRPQS